MSDFELIIVNDQSPDDIDSIVFSFNDSRIQYDINEKNIGGTDLILLSKGCRRLSDISV